MSDDGLGRRDFLKAVGAAGATSAAGLASGAASAAEPRTAVDGDPTELLGDLGSVVGSAYDERERSLYFVEYARGRLSKLDLVPSVNERVFLEQMQIRGTYTFNFDGARQTNDRADVWWEIVEEGERYLQPWNGTELALIGERAFEDVDPQTLPTLEYSSEPLDGSVDSDELTEGTMFAVKTNQGNYAKVRVEDRGYDLVVRFETFDFENPHQVIGTGYTKPEDVVLSDDGQHAYVTERSGTLLKVDLANADRADASVVASDLTAPHQISLDEPRDHAYLVEYAASGRLVRVDLTSGATTSVVSGLHGAVGLLVDVEDSTAYVSEQRNVGTTGGWSGPWSDSPLGRELLIGGGPGLDDGLGPGVEIDPTPDPTPDLGSDDSGSGTISRIDLTTGDSEIIAKDLQAPFFLTWGDEQHDSILFPERDPANRVSRLDLSDTSITVLADQHVSHNPSSLVVTTPEELLTCGGSVIDLLDLLEDLFGASPPLLMGIGHVPVGYISNGLANTVGAGVPINAVDAPFGGTLPINLNHEDARSDYGAGYYKVFVDGIEQRNPYKALRWNALIGRQESVRVTPDQNGFFELHHPSEIWYKPRLGYELNTRQFSDGKHTLTVEFYARADPSTRVASESITLEIDNREPRADIGDIFHKTPNGEEAIGACAIVDTPTEDFEIEVTAEDIAGTLKSWRLVAHWGNGKSQRIERQHYNNQGVNGTWTGINQQRIKWTAQERRCAHTLRLHVKDRTINGYHHVHRSVDRTSFTLMLPNP